MAIQQARQYLNEGKTWIIEMDLAQFFDRVNHDKLMGTLRKEITDKGTLSLIRKFLTCGIMEGGVASTIFIPINRCIPAGTYSGVKGAP